MLLPSRLRLIFVLWAVVETMVFVAVVGEIGLGRALLLGLITTLAGAGLLKRVGTAAVMRLRSGFPRRGEAAEYDPIDGAVRALAAVALLLPGFVSDAIGLALAVPAVRRAVIHRVARRWGDTRRPVARRRARGQPDAIDLSPEEWTSTPHGRGGPMPEA